MDGKLPPQFRIVLPIETTAEEARVHARARLTGVLASRFEIHTVGLLKTGEIETKHGIVYGKQFVVILRPLELVPEFVDDDDDEAEVLYEHPDYKKLIIH